MSTTPQTTLQLARQGNPDAIAALMNRHLEAQGITAQVVQQDGTLRVSLEADQVPNQTDLVAYVKKGITGLELAHIDRLTVVARQPGTDGHAWSEDLSLQPQPTALGTEFNTSSENDLDLDFDLDSPALEVQSLGDLDAVLDGGLDGTDLDFDLGFPDSSAEGLASADDFDLSFADSTGDIDFSERSTATDTADFDLSLADSDLDFDLDLDATAAPAADLDFDLGFTDATAEASTDLDFDFGLPETPAEANTDLDFDLGFADTPAEANTDLDFDLGFTDTPAEASADLDFDLEFADTPAEDLSFDLNLAEAEPSTDAAADDFGLGTDTPDIDLDLGLDLGAEADTTPLNVEPMDLGFSSETDRGAELDLGTGEAADFDFDLGSIGESEEAIAAPEVADFDFDFAPEAPNPNDTIASDLDDLWESGNTALDRPDQGFSTAADSSTAWGTEIDFPPLDDMAPLEDDGASSAEATVSSDDLAGLEFEPISADPHGFELEGFEPEGFEPEGFEPEGFETEEFDLTDLSSENLAQAEFVAEALDAEAIATEATAFPDLDLSSDAGLDVLSPELLPSEEVAFEDLGSADILDLSSPGGEADASDLGPSMSAADDLDSYLSSGTEELLDDQLAWASPDTPAADLDFSDDLDRYASDQGLSTDPSIEPSEGAAPDLAWGLEPAADDPGFVSDSTPPWGEGDFDAGFAPESTEEAGFDLGNEFDPGLVFDPAVEAVDMAEANVFTNDDFATANGGFADAGSDLAGAEPDFPFDSTMELDETVEGDFIPPVEFGDDAALLADSPFPQVDMADPVDLGFDGTDEDRAFESVELSAEDLAPGVNAADFADVGLGNEELDDVSFDNESFDNESFDNESFDNDGLGSDLFRDSASDSNGFLQDHDSLSLASDEPDAADDFIQEFGSDPSTHVALSPDQFDKDGSVKSSGGSGLPMRLILGLGLGALILVLAGLLLNGLVGRLRQPTPGDPMVTEPEGSAPDSPAPAPAPVAETDLFREAVNAAQNAANQAQTAGTSAQWQAVADSWARAIELMQQVPQSDPNYAVAQQKAVEYQPNRNYAQQNADRLR